MRDFHTHSSYSDGTFLPGMVRAAERAGLEGIGFADHCTVSSREAAREARATYGFALDLTYERRRTGIEAVREETDVAVYDAVELDYHPSDEPEIDAFLAEADFDYAVGSVHAVDGRNVQVAGLFEGESESDLDRLVDEYVGALVALIESELFEVAAHVDLVERTEPLRGRATDDHYRRVAEAFRNSRTVPEINAGRALHEPAIVHPTDRFLEILLERDVSITVGTDSHAPDEVEDRVQFLEAFVDERGIDPVDPTADLE
ncbi:PHP domain-containing protein [Natrialbaceae archaeon GCM10025810]|uniref:PHP domain-containing protein n=1 Tax=Halovalidus salilacus TaxID=3075124 RepID=UPI0036170BC4